jgi:stage II sporulation protein M
MKKLAEFYLAEFNQYLGRNKIFYLASVILLLFSVSVGYSLVSVDEIENINNQEFTPIEDWDKSTEFTDLFKHNFMIDLTCIIGGLTFSIYSLIVNFVNGAMVGYILRLAPKEIFILGIVPHGIFEIPSSVVAFVGSLSVTKIEINLIKGILQNNKTFKGELHNSRQLFKDVLISLLLVMILLIIAGFIEAYITPDLLNWYIGA